MSTTAAPSERSPLGRGLRGRARRRFSLWLLLPIGIALLGVALVAWQMRQPPTAVATTVQARQGDLSVSVSGSGSVAPARSLELGFASSGTVSAVLVQIGDTVRAGQPLARLDTRELELALMQAEANLKSAQAGRAAALDGGATELQIAAAQASLRSAQASYEQTRSGSTTANDIAAAEASLRSAQANLAELRAGPDAGSLSGAQSAVEQARLSLESQRGGLSAAKTRAESAVASAANSLRGAQDSYSTLYWDNRRKESGRAGLSQSDIDSERAALRAVSEAEQALSDAQVAYEQAKQDEIIGLQQAEGDLRNAQQQLEIVLRGATPAELTSAEAQVEQARATLASLHQGATPAELAQAQAQVDQARISLEELTSPEAPASRASAEASLAQAQVGYETARLNLERATLKAPFAGTVTAVGMVAGGSSSGTTISLIDTSSLSIDLSVSESDAGRIAVGQPVDLTFDALPETSLAGTIALIAPTATVAQNVVTYQVRVAFAPGSTSVKVGMSATGTIIVEQRSGILLVPTRAIQSQAGAQVVQVRPAADQPPVSVRVTTGLSSGAQTEIVSCLDTGALCLQPGDELVISAPTGAAGQTPNQGGFLGGLSGGGLSGGRRP